MFKQTIKKALSVIISLSLLLGFSFSAYGEEVKDVSLPQIVSETFCVMDAKTGQVIIERGMNTIMYPASITKILTAGLALERLSPTDRYAFSQEAATYDLTGTHLAFVKGEEVSVDDLLSGMMLASANDAAQGLAEAAAGSIDDFVGLMNEKAEELGAVNSHFTNPSGYHDGALVSTAYDMALITRWALGVEGFREYFGRWEYVIGPTNIKSEKRNLGTYHSMIVGPENNPAFGYEGATGGKLGWTPESTHTIVTVANRGDMELICVAMKSKNQYAKYKDSIALFDYVFDNFRYITIPDIPEGKLTVDIKEEGKKTGEVEFQNVKVLLPKGQKSKDITLNSPLPKFYSGNDKKELTLSVSIKNANGKVNPEAVLTILGEESNISTPITNTENKKDNEQKAPSLIITVVLVFVGLFVAMAVAVLIIRTYNINKYKKLREKRARRAIKK